MTTSQQELYTLCLLALRYTMGRATYAAGDVAKIISDHWRAFNEDQRRQLAREASRHLQSPDLDATNRFAYERIAALPVGVTE